MSSISGTGRAAARVAGWLAVVSTTAYFFSDVLEASHGGFTTVQLWLTLASEAALASARATSVSTSGCSRCCRL